MDITDALAPNSDQLDAIELVTPLTFTTATAGLPATERRATIEEITFG